MPRPGNLSDLRSIGFAGGRTPGFPILFVK